VFQVKAGISSGVRRQQALCTFVSAIGVIVAIATPASANAAPPPKVSLGGARMTRVSGPQSVVLGKLAQGLSSALKGFAPSHGAGLSLPKLPSLTLPKVSPSPAALPAVPKASGFQSLASSPLLSLGGASLSYTIHTVYQPPTGSQVVLDTPAKAFLPKQVNVTGQKGGADISVALKLSASGQASLTVKRLHAAPKAMPLEVEVTVGIPATSSGDNTAAIGYNALSSNAPTTYSLTVALSQPNDATTATITMKQTGAGSSISNLAELYEAASGGQKLNDEQVGLSYAPVPASASTKVTIGPGSALSLTSSTPVSVNSFGVSFGDGTKALGLTVQALPTSLSLSYDAGAGSINYSASAPVNQITIDASDPNGLVGQATAAHLLLQGVPTSLSLSLGQSGGGISLDAGGATVGMVQVQLTSGPDDSLPVGEDGVLLEDTSSSYVLFARIHGLQKADFNTGSDGSLDATLNSTGGQSFVGVVEDGSTIVDATVSALPSQLQADYSPSAGTITYSASSQISQLTLFAYNPSGLVGRATEASIDLQQVPTSLSLSLGQDGAGQVNLNAGGGSIGYVSALLTNGPYDQLPSGDDGVLLESTSSNYELLAQVHGLQQVSLDEGSDGSVTGTLDTAGGQTFDADLENGGSTTNATIVGLPSQVTVSLPSSGATVLNYSANSQANSMSLSTTANGGLSATMSPVATSMNICAAGDGSCIANEPDNDASIYLHASSPMNLSFTGDGINANVNLQWLDLGVGTTDNSDDNLTDAYVYLNTQGDNLSGNFSYGPIAGSLPSGFEASARLFHLHIDWFTFLADFPDWASSDASGQISCPSGTSINYNSPIGNISAAYGISIFGFSVISGICNA
jgi:hypothetical protein